MNIHFVCSGNVFRSMSADFLLRKYCKDNAITTWTITSSGTRAGAVESPFPQTIERLAYYGVNATRHNKTKTTKEVLSKQDIIICMTHEHKRRIEQLGFSAVLFNEAAYNKREDLLDEDEYGRLHGWDYNLQEYINYIVDYIQSATAHIATFAQKQSNA